MKVYKVVRSRQGQSIVDIFIIFPESNVIISYNPLSVLLNTDLLSKARVMSDEDNFLKLGKMTPDEWVDYIGKIDPHSEYRVSVYEKDNLGKKVRHVIESTKEIKSQLNSIVSN